MEKERLEQLVNIKTGKLNANASDENGIYPFFTCSKETLRINKYSYDCECVLVAGNGDLNAKYYNGKFDAYQRTYILTNKDKDKLNLKYLYYFMQNYVETLRNQSIGGVIKYIKLENLTEAKINLVSLEKQEEIINTLQKVEEIINERKKQIENLQMVVKSQFVEMFGELTINDKNWLMDNMGNYLTILTDFSSNGSYKTLDSQVIMYDKPNYAYMVRTTDLENDNYTDNVKYIDENSYNLLSKSKVYGNEIIMCKIGSAGKCYLMPKLNRKVSLGRNAFLFRYNDKINTIFMNYLLNTDYGKSEISKYVRGAVTKTITKDDARKIRIIVPPIELQNKFASFVELIDKQEFEGFKLEKLLKNLIDEGAKNVKF